MNKENINILFVEDEYVTQKFIDKVLSREFGNIYLTQNGEAALEFFRENRDKIDLVITDLNIPKKSGFEVIAEIKKIDIKFPILVISAYPFEEFSNRITFDVMTQNKFEQIQLEKNLFLFYMEKPISTPKLISQIKEIFNEIKK